MLKIHVRDLATRFARVSLTVSLERTEGAGNAGCTLHPRSRVQSAHRKRHTSIQVQRRQSGIPCAMALRLMPCSPRRRIRFCHRRCRLDGGSDPVGSISPPTAWHQQRVSGPHGFAVRDPPSPRLRRDKSAKAVDAGGNSAVRPARCEPLTDQRSALRLPVRADAAASTASSPAFRDDHDTPLLQGKDGQTGRPDLPDGLSEILPVALFCRSHGAWCVGPPTGYFCALRSNFTLSLRATGSRECARSDMQAPSTNRTPAPTVHIPGVLFPMIQRVTLSGRCRRESGHAADMAKSTCLPSRRTSSRLPWSKIVSMAQRAPQLCVA